MAVCWMKMYDWCVWVLADTHLPVPKVFYALYGHLKGSYSEKWEGPVIWQMLGAGLGRIVVIDVLLFFSLAAILKK